MRIIAGLKNIIKSDNVRNSIPTPGRQHYTALKWHQKQNDVSISQPQVVLPSKPQQPSRSDSELFHILVVCFKRQQNAQNSQDTKQIRANKDRHARRKINRCSDDGADDAHQSVQSIADTVAGSSMGRRHDLGCVGEQGARVPEKGETDGTAEPKVRLNITDSRVGKQECHTGNCTQR